MVDLLYSASHTAQMFCQQRFSTCPLKCTSEKSHLFQTSPYACSKISHKILKKRKLEHAFYEEKSNTAISFIYETIERIQFQFRATVSNKTQSISFIMSQQGPHRLCRNNKYISEVYAEGEGKICQEKILAFE